MNQKWTGERQISLDQRRQYGTNQTPGKQVVVVSASGHLAVSVLLSFVQGGFNNGIITLVAVSTSLLNVLIFYLILRKGKKRFKEIKRQQEFKKKIKAVSEPVSQIRHKCAICGQTDVSNPSLTFRYCSKCNGNYEYCNEHLFTHKHIE